MPLYLQWLFYFT